MAESNDLMNTRIDAYVLKPYFESYASSLPAVMNSQLALNTMINDKLIKAIAEGTGALFAEFARYVTVISHSCLRYCERPER